MTLNTVDKLNEARRIKALDKVYRFDSGVMTLGQYLDCNTWIEKTVHIRNHSNKKIELEYKKTKDTYAYTLWRMKDGNKLGTDVPKLVYDQYDIPERTIDNRF